MRPFGLKVEFENWRIKTEIPVYRERNIRMISFASVRSAVLAALVAALVLAANSARAQSFSTVYEFRGFGDGNSPEAGLINVGGILYGTTVKGGSGPSPCPLPGCGTVFFVTPTGEGVVYQFQGNPDGVAPTAPLTNVGNTFYGTTAFGGIGCSGGGCGIVFSVTRDGVETVLYRFQGGTDAAKPVAQLIRAGNTFYGTTEEGGGTPCTGGCGTVFSVTTAGVEKVLYRFKGNPDGVDPAATLIDVGGTFYGTTVSGGGTGCGGHGCGTVFSITPTGVEKVVYSFKGGTDGAHPFGGLLKVSSSLYGTTLDNGDGFGTVFSVTPAGVETVLYRFQGGNDGANPFAPLINTGNTLYGTTSAGGGTGCSGGGCGTVFSLTLAGVETVLHSFGGITDGFQPVAGLINVGGTLWGTTSFGSIFSAGTVFSLTPPKLPGENGRGRKRGHDKSKGHGHK
jgi:uncharacterized repeat protein (TIGR03803 family)